MGSLLVSHPSPLAGILNVTCYRTEMQTLETRSREQQQRDVEMQALLQGTVTQVAIQGCSKVGAKSANCNTAWGTYLAQQSHRAPPTPLFSCALLLRPQRGTDQPMLRPGVAAVPHRAAPAAPLPAQPPLAAPAQVGASGVGAGPRGQRTRQPQPQSRGAWPHLHRCTRRPRDI